MDAFKDFILYIYDFIARFSQKTYFLKKDKKNIQAQKSNQIFEQCQRS